MTLRRFLLTVLMVPMALVATPCLARCAQDAGIGPTAQHPPCKAWQFETTPVWQDEFNYDGLPDPSKWSFMLGGDGWGNNERQLYTDSIGNARVGNGVLTITARKKAQRGHQYTSARLRSKDKGDFLYGRLEARAKLPAGRGTWPAIWMMPSSDAYGGWPRSGEIDIMEHVGYDPGNIHITMHTRAYNHRINTQRGASKLIDNATTGFHIYRVDWTPDMIRGYIDDALVLEFPNEGTGHAAWPFDQPFHFILNQAVGGDWGGKMGVDDSVFPAALEIDYVRAYKLIE